MHHILYVDHTPFVGGAQLVLAEHLRHLDPDRYKPFVACTSSVPDLVEVYREAGAEVHLLSLPRLKAASPLTIVRLVRSAWRIRRLVRRERIHLVVSNTSRAAYICCLALAGTGVPLVWWVRDFLYGRPLFRLLGWFPTHIVCVSQAIANYYGGANKRKFRTIFVGNSIYRKADAVSSERIVSERARWGFDAEKVVVGFMGRLVADKGIEDLIIAVEILHRQFPQVRLLVVGTGAGQEGDVEERIKAATSEATHSSVVFAGYQNDEALYYQMFDLFVSSARAPEALPTSVIQSMMVGTPVIATDTGGTREIVRHEETGLLVAPNAPDEIAVALRRLIMDPDFGAGLARAGRELVMGRCREEITTEAIENVYSEILGE